MEVGSIFLYAWKYPRNTPRIPEIKIVGARNCSASLAFAMLSGISTGAPTTQISATIPPEITAYSKAPLKILCASR